MILLTGCNTSKIQPLTEPTPAIDPKLIEAVIQIESGGNPLAKSGAGAIGLMQIMPSTAKLLGYHPIEMWHPKINVEAGTKLLILLKEEHGNINATLRAYYCGNNHNRNVCYVYARRVMEVYEEKSYEGKESYKKTRKHTSNSKDIDTLSSTISKGYSFTY